MKKYLSLLSIPALMTLNSCLQEDIVKSNGEEVTAKVSITLPGNAAQSRADIANEPADPTLSNMRLFLFVYQGDNIVKTINATVSDFSTPFSTNIRLVTGQPYKIAAWADFGSGYYTVSTTDGTVELPDCNVTGNDTQNDAYYVCDDVTLAGNETVSLTLKRPFGLVQVTTNDWKEDAVVKAGLQPNQYTTTISVPTKLTLLSGEAGAPQNVTFAGTITNGDAEAQKLSFDYVLAGAEEQSVLGEFTMKYTKGDDEICNYTFSNIPVKRNFITNISGNILTKNGAVNVTINQVWDGEISENIEISASDLSSVLSNLPTDANATITLADDLPNETYTLPAMEEGTTLTINMKGAAAEGVTFSNEDFKGTVKFTNTATSPVNITITVPQGDATIGAGSWGTITAETRPNTLRIENGATITTVTVKKGNVNVYNGATVVAINKAEGNEEETIVNLFDGATVTTIDGNITTIEDAISGQIINVTTGKDYATIAQAIAAAKANDVIELAEGEYDLGEPGNPDRPGPKGYYLNIKTPITLLGKGNVTITTSHDANSGMGSLQNLINVNASDVTFKNITFKANYNTYYEGPNKIILVQEPNFTIENCTFIPNERVEDCSAAIYFALNATNGSVKNCTINNGCISFDGLMDASFNIIGNKFVKGTDNLAFTTPNWTSNDVTTSKLYVNIENNTFEEFEAYEEGSVNPAVRAYYGILNLKNNTFPTDGVYWKATKFGSIFVNYNSMISQSWGKDRTEPISFAISNDVIEFETQESPANTWYAWHGRKAAVNMNPKSSWEVTSTLTLTGEDRAVNKSMWLNIGIDWPIVLFKQDETGKRIWRYWDSNGSGAWLDVPAEKNVPTTAGDYKIKIAFNNGVITEYINDIEIASYEVSEKTSAVKEIIFNSYSIGESYKTTWTYPVVR